MNVTQEATDAVRRLDAIEAFEKTVDLLGLTVDQLRDQIERQLRLSAE